MFTGCSKVDNQVKGAMVLCCCASINSDINYEGYVRHYPLFQRTNSSSNTRDSGMDSPNLDGSSASGRFNKGAVHVALSYAKERIQSKAVE